MILNGFAGRTVRQVEREQTSLKVVFEDGGYLLIRARGPQGAWLKSTCCKTLCKPSHCTTCRGIEPAASE